MTRYRVSSAAAVNGSTAAPAAPPSRGPGWRARGTGVDAVADLTREQIEAAAWRSWWTDEAIEARFREEVAIADLLARYWVRMAGLDIREAIDDWPRVYDIVQARRRGYEPLDRTPKPWTAEDLDRDRWRDDAHPYSTDVPVSMRFRQVYPPRAVTA